MILEKMEGLMALLEVKNIHKDFVSGTRTVKAVNDVSFKIEQGEMVAVTGPSGAGKSTVLQICAGLMKPTHGSVTIEGNDLYKMEKDRLAEFRRNHISYIFQNFNLISMLTARENIAVPSLLNGIKPNEAVLREITDTL